MLGYANTGLPGQVSCDKLKNESTIEVQDGIHLYDNLLQIAQTLESHPIVVYPQELLEQGLLFSEVVEATWSRMSGSSIWLPDQKIFLSVTRVIFYTTGRLDMPKMSFLRGQVYDQDWNHLENHVISWNGQTLTFPLVFNEVHTEYEKGGIWYGTEDPRIVIEEGVEHAEPVVVFNMISKRSEWSRAMWIFRPFSGFSTVLTIQEHERGGTEKNWAPFFVTPPPTSPGAIKKPSEHLHFIYEFRPLRILRCHLHTGTCEYVFEQMVSEDLITPHQDGQGSLRGGTNFVPVPLAPFQDHPKLRVWAGFPRTHIDAGCGAGVYRPHYVVLVKTGSHFHITYASDALDLGNAVLSEEASADPCDKGRILIPNSISSWDTRFESGDVMTVTFSVSDTTVQVARMKGLLAFTQGLPRLQELLTYDSSGVGRQEALSARYSAVGEDVRACSVEAGTNHTWVLGAISDEAHPERIAQRVEEAKIRQEEEAILAAAGVEGAGPSELGLLNTKLFELVNEMAALEQAEPESSSHQAVDPGQQSDPQLQQSAEQMGAQDPESLRARLLSLEQEISQLRGVQVPTRERDGGAAKDQGSSV